jgi:ribosomal protein S18 acetylase RimI-like enzyme
MIELHNGEGEVCAEVQCFPTGTDRCALAFVWSDSIDGEPDCALASSALRGLIEDARTREVRRFESRVITEQAGAEAARVAARAMWLQSLLAELEFERVTIRVEYRLPLSDALERLESIAKPPRLSWIPVATQPGPELERAARVLRAVEEGRVGATQYDDPEGYLLSRREDSELLLLPESLQIGLLGTEEVSIVAPSVAPANGWCSLFHFGVVPAFRGQKLGTEAMLHGLRAMRPMGGVTYHDGTDAGNAPMRALFDRIGAPRFRIMEEWSRAL